MHDTLTLPVLSAPPIARARDKTTSHAAADRLTSRGVLVGKVLRAFARAGEHGCTASEIADAVAVDGSWKRISDCERLGWVRDAGVARLGTSGRMQAVRVITDAGLATLAALGTPTTED